MSRQAATSPVTMNSVMPFRRLGSRRMRSSDSPRRPHGTNDSKPFSSRSHPARAPPRTVGPQDHRGGTAPSRSRARRRPPPLVGDRLEVATRPGQVAGRATVRVPARRGGSTACRTGAMVGPTSLNVSG